MTSEKCVLLSHAVTALSVLCAGPPAYVIAPPSTDPPCGRSRRLPPTIIHIRGSAVSAWPRLVPQQAPFFRAHPTRRRVCGCVTLYGLTRVQLHISFNPSLHPSPLLHFTSSHPHQHSKHPPSSPASNPSHPTLGGLLATHSALTHVGICHPQRCVSLPTSSLSSPLSLLPSPSSVFLDAVPSHCMTSAPPRSSEYRVVHGCCGEETADAECLPPTHTFPP